jgi:hypothetical protein
MSWNDLTSYSRTLFFNPDPTLFLPAFLIFHLKIDGEKSFKNNPFTQ